ncbi:MAG: hypothetical protein MH213_16015 [Marinobacter sp.]|nr:hypothetical protein [Marinobacter sp.]
MLLVQTTPQTSASLLTRFVPRASQLDDAPELANALERFTFELEYGDRVVAASELLARAQLMVQAADRLLNGPVDNPRLLAEVRPGSSRSGSDLSRVEVANLAAADRLDAEGPSSSSPVP